MPTFSLVNGSAEPETHTTSASTVGELRSEMSFGENTVISVDGTKAADSRQLLDGSIVSAVSTNKTGG